MKDYTPKDWLKSNLVTNKKIEELKAQIGGDVSDIEEDIRKINGDIESLGGAIETLDGKIENRISYIHGEFSRTSDTCVVTENANEILEMAESDNEIFALFTDSVNSRVVELYAIRKEITETDNEITNVTLFFGNCPDIDPVNNRAEIINIVVNVSSSVSGQLRILDVKPPMVVEGTMVDGDIVITDELVDIAHAFEEDRPVYLHCDIGGNRFRLNVTGYSVSSDIYNVLFNTMSLSMSGTLMLVVLFTNNSKTGTLTMFEPQPLT